ncbi:MAG: hypothetical protein N3A53_03325, partial [Verrucomicrobiae bacterium]|nr:hypothetical protein [Verrucomicrobiae bacterium]
MINRTILLWFAATIVSPTDLSIHRAASHRAGSGFARAVVQRGRRCGRWLLLAQRRVPVGWPGRCLLYTS